MSKQCKNKHIFSLSNRRVCEKCYDNEESRLLPKKSKLQNQRNKLIEEGSKFYQEYSVHLEIVDKLERIKKLKLKTKQINEYNLQRFEAIYNQKAKQLQELQRNMVKQQDQYNLQVNVSNLDKKKLQITEKQRLLQFKKYNLLAQMPLLHDVLFQYSKFTFGQDEVQKYQKKKLIIQLHMDQNGNDVNQTMQESDLEQSLQLEQSCYQDSDQVQLLFRKQQTFEKEVFSLQYKQNFDLALKNMILFIYRIQQIQGIPLPFPIYIDQNHNPQFMIQHLYEKHGKSNLFMFNDTSLSHLQLNIYYIIYQMGGDLETILTRGKHFDLLQLLNICLRQSSCKYASKQQEQINKILLDGYIIAEKQQIGKRSKLIQMQYATSLENKFYIPAEDLYIIDNDIEFIK